MNRLLMAAILGSGAMFAQVTSSSVTVTVSRDLNLQPDQATFSVVVTTPTWRLGMTLFRRCKDRGLRPRILLE